MIGQRALGSMRPAARIARAMSSTPVPREDSSVVALHRLPVSSSRFLILTSPSNLFGSGNSSVASVPLSSSSVRGRAESKEKMLCADCPDSNWAIALTWLGTITSNSSPALGPDPITLRSLALDPSAATAATGPNVWISAVR